MSGISRTSFIERSRKVHGDKYDYSETVINPDLRVSGWKSGKKMSEFNETFNSMHPPVKIRCKRHDHVFYEYPSRHYRIKRYPTRRDVVHLPICCSCGNDLIFLNGGFEEFLTKVEKLGQTMTREQITEELDYPSRPYADGVKGRKFPMKASLAKLYKDITKAEKHTHTKIKIKTGAGRADVKYKGKSGWINTRWGLSLFENGTEKERECKSCKVLMTLDNFYIPYKSNSKPLSTADPTPRRECKTCWKENKTKVWRKEHPHYAKDRMKTDPLFKLTCNLRTSVSNAISTCKKIGVDATKKDKTLNLLGAQSWRQVFDHFESLFTPGMTWENHGGGHYGKREWHIDHIKPIDYFIKNMDFTLLEVQMECFNLLNLQPLWATDNLTKSNSFIEKDVQKTQPLHELVPE